MELHVHIHNHPDKTTSRKLDLIITNQQTQMATIQEVNQKLTDLQAAVDAEQQEIADALAALQAEVQSLKDIIAAGSAATPEQLQEIVTNIDTVIADVQSSIPNLPPPTPEG